MGVLFNLKQIILLGGLFLNIKKRNPDHKSKEVETGQGQGDLRQLPSDLFSTWSEKCKTSSKRGLWRKRWNSVHFGEWPHHWVSVIILAFFQWILLSRAEMQRAALKNMQLGVRGSFGSRKMWMQSPVLTEIVRPTEERGREWVLQSNFYWFCMVQ